jgi:Ca2+-binding RTX toxin-like protein
MPATTRLSGGNDGDSILGGLGADSIVSGSGNDTIYGGAGDDTIVGSAGQDSLFGDAGDNLFQFANGVLSTNTTLDGGTGTNTLSFTQDLTTAVDADFTNVTNIDRIYTADGAGSSLTLGTEASQAGVSTVQGGNGNDAITLQSGFTTTVSLFGGAGDDTITVNSYSQIDPSGTSQDFINGETGTNTLAFATALGTSGSTAVINDSNVSNIQILQLADTASNYVQVDGAFGIDTIIGGSTHSNYINAQGLSAGNAITLIGGNASDTLLSGPGSDWLQGFADGVPATSASDTLTGGDLSDTFVLGDSIQNAYAGGGVQATINGFTIDGAFNPVTSDLFRLFANNAALTGSNPTNFVAGLAPNTWGNPKCGCNNGGIYSCLFGRSWNWKWNDHGQRGWNANRCV